MTNTELLKQKIDESGLKLGFIAEKLGLSYASLQKRLEGKIDLKAYEIQIFCNLLSITDLTEKDSIFFAQNVEETSTM